MKITKKIAFVLLSSLLFNQAIAQTKEELAALEGIGSTFNEGKLAPGGVLTVAKNGVVIYNKAFGSANLEFGIDNTLNTVFEAGSVSKQFTATAILLLINEGKLALTDDVRKYIPELPDYGTPIAVKHLVTHTSGIKDWGSIFSVGGWPRGTKAYQQADALAMICRQKTLNFSPGVSYSYSNSNFTLLAILVERITKMPFASFTTQRIFEPVGMANTRWRDNFRAVVKNRAIGYGKSGSGFVQDMPFENTHGHGGLLTTTQDLLKWSNYWNENKFGEAVSKLRLSPGTLNDGRKIEYTYGAVFLKTSNNFPEISHSGLTAGYRGWLAYYPEQHIIVACLSNGIAIPSKNIGEVFTGKPGAKKLTGATTLSQELATQLVGLYRGINSFETLEMVQRDGKLFMKTGAEVFKQNGDTLATTSRYMKLNPDHKGFLSIIGTDTLSYIKVGKFTPSVKDLEKYTGNYYSAEADVAYTLRVEKSGLVAYRNNEPAIPLKPIYQNVFIADGVVLDLNKTEQTGSFTANVDRATNLVFRKQ